jgi:hypothetical protein
VPIEAPQQEPVLCDIFVVGGFSGLGGGGWMRCCCYAEAKRYIITDEMPPELHNLIGRKVTHAGIYTEAIVVHGPPAGDLLAARAREIA